MPFSMTGCRRVFVAAAVALGFVGFHEGARASGAETVLYSFCTQPNCADGADPAVPPIMDQSGNLIGTTFYGANTACNSGAGCGTVYKLVPNGGATVLYTFCSARKCRDGAQPGILIADSAGNLYGTAAGGGNELGENNCPDLVGCGVIFKLSPDGAETVLYTFCSQPNCPDGAEPGALISDGTGDFYGLTSLGGANMNCSVGCGTIFKLAANGTETVLYSFCSQSNCTDGNYPVAMLLDPSGNFYGETAFGGDHGCNCGVVFKFLTDGTETVLHTFTGGSDGGLPSGGLLEDSAGYLYGAAQEGGDKTNCYSGCGVIFKLSPDGTETVIYTFTGGSNGAYPTGGLIADSAGNLYGTASGGGKLDCRKVVPRKSGCGVIFEISPSGAETVLYKFKGVTKDGSYPAGGLFADSVGNLYGTTFTGGSNTGCFYHGRGCGTIYELKGQMIVK
ncbi:MAG TPA: choice-of-anchor tandem repeat GloVer-containing protein [Rhizomicrobium sp.]